MTRCVLLALVLLLHAGLASGDEEIDRIVASHVERLLTGDLEAREAAECALVELGQRAEPAVRREWEQSTDPEVRERLSVALAAYAQEREEAFAIECIRRAEPFPPPDLHGDEVILSGRSLLADLSAIADITAIEIVTYEEDPALASILDATRGGEPIHPTNSAGAVRSILAYLLRDIDVTAVADRGRIVIVRLTPAVVFAQMAVDDEVDSLTGVALDLWRFEHGPAPGHSTIFRVLGMKSGVPGERRDRWFAVLRDRALDPATSEAERVHALHGLKRFVDATARPDEAVDAVFVALAGDASAPRKVAWAALHGLACAHSPAGQEAVLGVIEGDDVEGQARLLWALSCFQGFTGSWLAGDAERVPKALARLSSGPDERVATLALCLRSYLGDRAAREGLVDRPRPAERGDRFLLLEALSAIDSTRARERLSSFSRDGEADTRAAVAALLGGSYGRAPIPAEFDAGLRLLEDEDARARGFAAEALGGLAARVAGNDPARARVQAALETRAKG